MENKVEKTPDLTDVEMLEILKTIARDGRNGAARIAAIRELRAVQAGGKVDEDGFAKLYAVESPRLHTKAG